MKFNEAIKTKIEQYRLNKISKYELSTWAKTLMHQMLSGEILDLEKIAFWQFITILTEIDSVDVDEKYANADIMKIINVLDGNENLSYSFRMKIPKIHQKKEFEYIKNCLTEAASYHH